MIRVGAVGQIERQASAETTYDIRGEASPQFVPRPRGAVVVGSAVRPPAA